MEQFQLEPGRGISDENVAESAAFVRALVVARLEQAWRACDPHIQVQRNPETGLIMRPDPRFIEAGIRILDRLSTLYRLTNPQMVSTDTYQDTRAGIEESARNALESMESRLRDPAT